MLPGHSCWHLLLKKSSSQISNDSNMKRNIFRISYLLVFLTALVSCTTVQKKINVDALLCVAPEDGKLPDDVREILLPFQKGDSICLPQGSVLCQSGDITYIKGKSTLEKWRENITKNVSFLTLREKTTSHLTSLDLSSLKKSPVGVDFINQVSSKYELVLGYLPDSKAPDGQFAFRCFQKPDQITSFIRDSVVASRPQCKILIICNPPFTGNAPAQDTVQKAINQVSKPNEKPKPDQVVSKGNGNKGTSIDKTKPGGGGHVPDSPRMTSKDFSNNDRYVGEIKNGIMHGAGTYYYAVRELISPKDLKKRYAEPGDYLVGEWFEGLVSSGVLYNKANVVKERIIIGHSVN